MKCPYLRETQVRFCRASVIRKMIIQMPGRKGPEKCSSPDYADCPVLAARGGAPARLAACPFLQEMPAQYCAAAPGIKLIPSGEARFSRCSGETYRYCDLYLVSAARRCPTPGGGDRRKSREGTRMRRTGGIRVPQQLFYSAGHMWLDVGDTGCCHVGLDEFLTRLLGRIDGISFVSRKGVQNPTAVLTVRGVDLQMVFPNRMLVTRTHSYLRARPEQIVSDPYGTGWLFEGMDAGSPAGDSVRKGLVRDTEARLWMQTELRRLSRFLRSLAPLQEERIRLEREGPSELIAGLEREQMLELFNEFFPPGACFPTTS